MNIFLNVTPPLFEQGLKAILKADKDNKFVHFSNADVVITTDPKAEYNLPTLLITDKKTFDVGKLASFNHGYGVLSTQSDADDLHRYLHMVVSGVRTVHQDIKMTEVEENLSSREIEILTLLAEGKKIKDIATILDIEEKTVATHKHNLMKKLDLHDILQVFKYALREGYVSMED